MFFKSLHLLFHSSLVSPHSSKAPELFQARCKENGVSFTPGVCCFPCVQWPRGLKDDTVLLCLMMGLKLEAPGACQATLYLTWSLSGSSWCTVSNGI